MEVAGVPLDRVDRDGAIGILASFLRDGRGHQVVTVNTDFVRLARANPEFEAIIRGADLAVADGMPLVWLSRLAGSALPERVTGFDLVDGLCRSLAADGLGLFLLGGAPGVAESAGRTLVHRYPGLRIAGTYAPPFGPHTAEQDERTLERIAAAGRCALLVAFGAPRQDLFIHEHLGKLDAPVAIGVGCALDILSGTIPRAPDWMQRIGLEWLWRLAQEPGRLWRRYLTADAPMLGRLALAAIGEGIRRERFAR